MQAAFALVESGVELTTSEVEKAIGRRERRGLLDGYFKRLVRSNNLAERYVMKFALPLVPETARVDILRGLVNAGDVDAELFVIAASFDQSKRVRRWATNWLAQHPSALLRMDEYREYLDAYGLTEKFKSAVATSVQGAESKRKRLEARTGADRPLTPPGIVTGKTTGSVLPSPNLPVDTNSAPVVGETPVEFYRVNN
jgi:hypothetical protein